MHIYTPQGGRAGAQAVGGREGRREGVMDLCPSHAPSAAHIVCGVLYVYLDAEHFDHMIILIYGMYIKSF